MPGVHALLSPSSGKRWLTCTPSVRLEQQFDDSESVYAQEGTLWHSLNELLTKRKLRRILEKDFKRELGFIEKHELYTDEMYEDSEEYAVYVMEKYHEALARTKDAKIFLETQVDISAYAPESFGTADVAILADDTMVFIDGKYGRGVPVSAIENEQCMLYALGLLDAYGWMYSIKKVQIVIYQPRINNVNSWTVTIDTLTKWGEEFVKPRAKAAFAGEGEYIAGDHCKFCRARNRCRTIKEYYMGMAVEVFKDPQILTNDEVSEVLTKVSGLVSWAEGVKDYVTAEMKKGAKWPGWKLVEGKSNRIFPDEAKVISTLREKGYKDETIFDTKLRSVAQMEKQLGKSDFGAFLNVLVKKPYGKPTLTIASDKRPEYDRAKEASDVFNEEA